MCRFVSEDGRSEILVQKLCMLKNKYDLHVVSSTFTSDTFIHHKKKIRPGSVFCVLASVASILIGKDDKYEKTHTKNSDSVCKNLLSY